MTLIRSNRMNFQICTFNKFYPICILKTNKIRHKKYLLNDYEEIIKSISSGQGSLTRYFQYLTSIKTWVTKLQITNNLKTLESRKIRCVWIQQPIELKLASARSLWKTIYQKTSHFGKLSKIPIGIHTIYNKIDTEKITNEIYYGYCKEIELFRKNSIIITGRKSTLHYRSKHSIIMQEFFPIRNTTI